MAIIIVRREGGGVNGKVSRGGVASAKGTNHRLRAACQQIEGQTED